MQIPLRWAENLTIENHQIGLSVSSVVMGIAVHVTLNQPGVRELGMMKALIILTLLAEQDRLREKAPGVKVAIGKSILVGEGHLCLLLLIVFLDPITWHGAIWATASHIHLQPE